MQRGFWSALFCAIRILELSWLNPFLEVLTISKKELLINEQIRAQEVRVVSEDGEQLGIMPVSRALQVAADRNLDLVLIAPQAVPPVCRIMDYGKHKFEQAKREKEAKKNQKVIETKEIRLSLNIDDHDLETKLKSAAKFLNAGDKVKVSIRFRGREMAHPERGTELLKRVAEQIAEHGTVERMPKMEGRSMVMFIVPNKKPVNK
ncbi:MAG TPA: translation initiation factor IF-3 [Clostridiales bacterium]|mgnify:CR=1 FL=1|nr:translation initiation factor IF-3 [Clostridiales bacterium]